MAAINQITCVDLFCGVGGLTHGLVKEGINVKVGVDLDPVCQYPYEANNDAVFLQRDVSKVTGNELRDYFCDGSIKVLAGCAPCQPFSTYAQRYESDGPSGKWGLLYEFARIVEETDPEIVTMENVSTVTRHSVFHDFVDSLQEAGYKTWFDVVDSAEYGVPQTRRRLVLLASKLGPIQLCPPTRKKPRTVQQVIGELPAIGAGETSAKDPMHTACSLSELNMKRIQASKPGGTWRDWPEELVADCHKAKTGKTYPSVYGRMEWDKPAPTMTTQCHGYGNGRFGHPDQDRAISLREAALIQSFPKTYKFLRKGELPSFSAHGRLIGNAVPVGLGRAIGRSIKQHVEQVTP